MDSDVEVHLRHAQLRAEFFRNIPFLINLTASFKGDVQSNLWSFSRRREGLQSLGHRVAASLNW